MKKQELFNNVTEGFPYQRQPQQVGLYDAAYEHDACGVGMLVNIHGEKSHDIVESALKVLENMRHRGAEGADNKTGDGAGIMLQIPHEFILLQGIPVPEKGRYGTGLLFLPKNEKDQAAILSIIIEEIEKEGTDLSDVFAGCKGILVPGGFGDRGVEGKISAIKYARENKIPFLGLCLGMQCSVIEFARHVCGMEDAHSSEFNPETNHPVIALMSSQINVEDKGGTMRLGSYPCKVTPGTKTYEAYGSELIHERHRHRFEFNNEFKQELTDAGLVIAGVCPDNGLVEIVEVKDHPWFVASQFHPELKSRPNNPQPLFRDFVKAALAVGK